MTDLNKYVHAMEIDEATGKPMPKVSTIVKSQQSGSWFRLAAEVKPTEVDGVQNGDDLLIVDTKEVYIFYKGVWYVQ